MALISSPLLYPPTSSPHLESPRKKRKLDAPRQPLHDVEPNTTTHTLGGFLVDDSDGEDACQHDTDAKEPGSQQYSSVEELQQQIRPAAPHADNGTVFGNGRQAKLASSSAFGGREEQRARLQDSGTQPLAHTKAASCSGKIHNLKTRKRTNNRSYEELVDERSMSDPGRARKSYYGIDIHDLVEQAKIQLAEQKDRPYESYAEPVIPDSGSGVLGSTARTLLWTEKYRARKFTDLVGDERTHRSVLRWLKAWDPIVFPGSAKPKPKHSNVNAPTEERAHRKMLLLTGPPGLGKTTLAHVCAKQAGYEVQEINASDERSRDVVKGRIRDMVGTENVRPVDRGMNGKSRKAARPVCVIVDEVDGVVGGNSGSGGEGGFVKALADLLALDQKNSSTGARAANADNKKRKKGDSFRLLRPLVLICNDVYHPSLRLLRQGTMAEIIYVRKPAINMLVPRMQSIFEREGIPCDSDGVRQLCEAAWGVSSRKEDKAAGGASDGDMRGVLVVAEWVASKIKNASQSAQDQARLTKNWVETHMLKDLAHGGGSTRSLGRGGTKEIVERVFTHNAGFPAGSAANAKKGQQSSTIAPSAADTAKQRNCDRLRELIDSSGEDERIISDCFTTYPTLPFQDDTFLSKPASSTEWLHFHDALSSRVFHNQDWELAAYLSTPVLGFHHLFASTSRHSYNANSFAPDPETEVVEKPFSGPRASYEANEATKVNLAALQHLQTQLSLPLTRAFRSPSHLSVELLPFLLRMLGPDVKPVVVGGSEKGVASVRRGAEKDMVRRAVDAMIACGITFDRSRVDIGEGAGGATSGGFVYRMEPGLDALGVFETMGHGAAQAKVRYAVRQVLEQEQKREVAKREADARLRRMGRGGNQDLEGEGADADAVMIDGTAADSKRRGGPGKTARSAVKRDFFGRPIVQTVDASGNAVADSTVSTRQQQSSCSRSSAVEDKVWVTYHEGYSNAVKKGITLKELLHGL